MIKLLSATFLEKFLSCLEAEPGVGWLEKLRWLQDHGQRLSSAGNFVTRENPDLNCVLNVSYKTHAEVLEPGHSLPSVTPFFT